MKKLIFSALFLVGLCSFGQTATVGFSEINQIFNFSEKSITVKIEVNNLEAYKSKSNVPFTLQIFSPDIGNDSLARVSKTRGLDVIIPLNTNSYDVIIPIDPKLLKLQPKLTLELKKAVDNDNYEINRNTLTIVLQEKPAKQAIVSILKVDNDEKIRIDFSKYEEIQIPFILKLGGRSLNLEDEASIMVKINGLSEYKKEHKFKLIGKGDEKKVIKISLKDNAEVYKKILNELKSKDKDKLELELHTPNTKSSDKNDLVIHKKNAKISFDLKKENTLSANYDFYLGTNFDLKDRFEATSFYAQVDAFLPELHRKHSLSTCRFSV